jgi:hypothetical protein
MDIERTMEFILEQHARNEAALVELMAAQKSSSRRTDRLERTATRLAPGAKARTNVNGQLEDHEKWFARQQAILAKVDLIVAEINRKLNALLGNARGSSVNPPQS